MLKLRRGTVVGTDPLEVEVGGRAPARLGGRGPGRAECERGDEVVVNTAAVDLGLGSGGFDVVHVNLTRGLEAARRPGVHVMKLNYTSLQHPVEPVEAPAGRRRGPARRVPVLVLPLHGHLAPVGVGGGARGAGLRVGFVQAGGGGLPGTLSGDVRELRERGLLCGHVTAGPVTAARPRRSR